MAKKEVKEIKEVSRREIKETPVEFITSGCTMINLAASQKGINGGWARGRIANIVGDGSSGKTALALETAAHAFYKIAKKESDIFSPVKNVRIRYNYPEQVMDFPLKKMYGQEFVDGVEWVATREVEQFGRDFTRQCMNWKPGEFLLYIVDSWDSLQSHEAIERFEEAAKKDEEEEGSYGTEKAKYGSKFFANIAGMMEGKDITLIIISQVRQVINAMTFGKKTYRTGGKSLDFYTHQVVWLAEIEKMKNVVKGNDVIWGVRSKGKFERNKVAKPFREAEFRILFDYGIDDLGSMVDWYYGPKVKAIEFDGEKMARADFIKYIEDNSLEDEIRDMVEKEWLSIEATMEPDRKAKFGD